MTAGNQREQSTRIGAALGAVYFASFGALGLYAPYFPLWLDAHGFNGAAMGFIAALVPTLSFFGPPLLGALSDARGGRGSLLSAASALGLAGMAGLCLAEWLGAARAFGIVFLASLAYAASRSGLILLADRISIEHGGSYGRRRVWGSIGFMLAAIGFGHWVPPQAARWLPGWVALALAAALALSFVLPRATSVRRAPALRATRRSLARREFAVFAACSALSAASSSGYDLCAPLFFRDLGASTDTIGWLYGTAVLAEVVLLACAGAFLPRLGPAHWLGLAYAGSALRWLCMSALSSVEVAFVLQPLHAISFALTWTASLEYVRRSSEPHLFGSAQGAFMAANAVGSVVGMLTWGPLYASAGGATVFRVAAALSCGAALLAYAALVRQRALAIVGASH